MSYHLKQKTATLPVTASKTVGRLVMIAWQLMAIVVVMSFIPLNNTIWFVAAPILPVAFILTVYVLARGGMVQGMALMACHVLVMPLVVAFGPLAIPVAAASSADDSSSVPPAIDSQCESSSRLSPKLLELKEKLSQHRSEVTRWLAENLAVEKDNGYLSTNSEKDIDIQTRRAIQQENLWREEAFKEISRISGRPIGEIAATYARLAARK